MTNEFLCTLLWSDLNSESVSELLTCTCCHSAGAQRESHWQLTVGSGKNDAFTAPLTCIYSNYCYTYWQNSLCDTAVRHRAAGSSTKPGGFCPPSCAVHTNLGRVESGTVSSRNAASQKADLVHRSTRVDLGQGDVGHHGVLGEGTGSHEVKQLLSLASEA